jgi:hypothetical protein
MLRQLRPLSVYTSGMTAMQRTLLAVIAIGATISALFLGEHVGGPLARAILGPPAGFHEDFTSRAALGQALLVQTVCWPRILFAGQLQGGDSRVTVI